MQFRARRIRDWTFWHYQAIGWPIFALAHVTANVAVEGFSWKVVTHILLQVLAGFLLSLVLREYFRRVPYHRVSLPSIVVRVIVGAFVMTAVWYCALIAINAVYVGAGDLNRLLTFRQALYIIVLIYPEKLVWGALYFGIKFWRDWIVERERAENAEEEARQAQLQALRYQLNPHFLFNSLNSLRALIDEDSQQAWTMITELSEFLRYSLVSRNRTAVTLREEVAAVRHYLTIEKKRYEEKLEVKIDVQPKAEEYPVPIFLIHPLVENSIKFGMQTSSLPLRVQLIAEVVDHTLRISVVNSGRWLEHPPESIRPTNETAAGLHTVKARLQQAFPGRHALDTYERDGDVVVTLSLHYDQEIQYEEATSGHR
jgi:two-component system LytT family sensor kinase